jgi:hypothetical protein
MGFPRTWLSNPQQMSLRFCGKKQRFLSAAFYLREYRTWPGLSDADHSKNVLQIAN